VQEREDLWPPGLHRGRESFQFGHARVGASGVEPVQPAGDLRPAGVGSGQGQQVEQVFFGVPGRDDGGGDRAETAIGLLKIDFLLDKNQLMRSKTPEGIDQELYATLVGYQLTRQLVHSVAAEHGLDPDRISHTGALTEARISLITHAQAEVAYQLARLILAAAGQRNPHRPNRAHRRQVRQPTRAWPDLTPHQPDENGRCRYELHIDWPELGHPPGRDPTVTNPTTLTSRNLN
jgi:hypothetical protein